MEYSYNKLMPHPKFLDTLFAFKSNVSNVFKDVLDIHQINHIAITRVDKSQQLLVLSSTPAMEYNLFTSNLWRYDNNYNPEHFCLGQMTPWPTLYQSEKYNELYAVRQLQHNFPTGFSLASTFADHSYIYSFASRHFSNEVREELIHIQDDFSKIGQYCANLLNPVFDSID